MKHHYMYIGLAIILGVMIIMATKPGNIAGNAYYTPIQIKGEVKPALTDGTIITFKVGSMTIAEDKLIDSKYGHEETLYFTMDVGSTTEKEGYTRGNKVQIYIEEIKIGEISFFESHKVTKDLIIPQSLREEISTKIAQKEICLANWDCSEWGTCNNNKQTRICIDKNNCKGEKPLLEQECQEQKIIPPTLIQENYTMWITLGIIALIAGIIVGIMTKRKK